MKKILLKNWPETVFIAFALFFSLWLMGKTFGSDPNSGTISIAAKAYSDFAANLPLIRSFSQGENFPPEYPLFPGESIRYHFLFYLLVGFLEKLGIPLGLALNIPSALGFFALLLMIYFLAKLLFKSRAVALLTILFFLFNGSFGFFYFFQKHPLSFPQVISGLLNNQEFSAFGPYDQGVVTGFWNLNIYTNQRHLASGLFFTLLPLYLFLKSRQKKKALSLKTSLILGTLVGLLPFWHATGFIMSLTILAGLFLLLPYRRRTLLIIATALILAFPQFLYLTRSGGITSFHFHPGYLIASPLTAFNFLRFWFLNFGFAFFLIPLGVLSAPGNTRRVFLIVFPVFLLGNLFQFSPDMAINHKFFNLFLIVGNMFVAYVLVVAWQKHLLTKILVPLLILALTLSGVIDFLAIKNDRSYLISDAPQNPDVVWIEKNTPPSSVFLNSTYLYHPASLAGRKIFLGWPYFPWSAGYNTDKRGRLLHELYREKNFQKLCRALKENEIDYISTEKQPSPNPDFPIVSPIFEEKFVKLYTNPHTSFSVYGQRESCL